ncbi:Ankyrin repeat domain-containing protein 31 [Quillaja saponaria]|uniref:Ankyrin repeat domain-containing protein 31 n=1 Tax=Quillaja saponaria TaxID=32244 RepID=A0AAD7Q692_QUISA|nr:Ankyrin repeat domain-containing protein 31 [Quillaja saponaria]
MNESENSETVANVLSDVRKNFKELIVVDDNDGLVSAIKAQWMKEDEAFDKGIALPKEILPRQLLTWVTTHGAVKCATALLERQTCVEFNLNEPTEDGLYPLHYAAQSLSPKMIELLIDHGAMTDVRCKLCDEDDSSKQYHGLLPINLAVETFCKHQYLKDWNPRKSVFLLLYVLCLPELQESLGAISSLASKTDDIEIITCQYAKEGKLMELATLQMVAWKKLLPSNTSQSESENCNDPAIRQCIMRELQSLIDEEFRLIGSSGKLVQACKYKKASMASALLLLEVFERAGSGFDKYLSVEVRSKYSREYDNEDQQLMIARDVMWMLKAVGFNLENRDTDLTSMDCFSMKLDPERSEKLWSLLKNAPKPPTYPPAEMIRNPSQRKLLLETYFPTYDYHIRREMSTASHYRQGCRISCPQAQSYHTFERSELNLVSRLSNSVESRIIEMMKIVEPLWSNTYARKSRSFLALARKLGR